MTPPEHAAPLLRVVRGTLDDEELAALVAVVAARAAGAVDAPARRPRVGRWGDPRTLVRRPLAAGPGAWGSALR